MDINLTLINGRLAVPAMIDIGEDGARVLRALVLVRSEKRRRVDVIPVRMTDPAADMTPEALGAGRRLFIAGALLRRCRPDGSESGGRLEVAADSIALHPDDRPPSTPLA